MLLFRYSGEGTHKAFQFLEFLSNSDYCKCRKISNDDQVVVLTGAVDGKLQQKILKRVLFEEACKLPRQAVTLTTSQKSGNE